LPEIRKLEIHEELINEETIKKLKEAIEKITLNCNNGKELQKELLILGVDTGLIVYPYFAEQLDNLILTGDNNPFYFLKVKGEALELLSILLSYISERRRQFQERVIEKRLSVEEKEAGTGLKL